MSENIPKMGYTGFHAKSPFGRRGRKSYNECTFGMKACIQSTYASLDHHHTHVTREIHNHVKKDRCRDEWMYTRIGDGSTLERNSFESHSTTWGDWIRKNNRKIFLKKVRVDNLLWETKGNRESGKQFPFLLSMHFLYQHALTSKIDNSRHEKQGQKQKAIYAQIEWGSYSSTGHWICDRAVPKRGTTDSEQICRHQDVYKPWWFPSQDLFMRTISLEHKTPSHVSQDIIMTEVKTWNDFNFILHVSLLLCFASPKISIEIES